MRNIQVSLCLKFIMTVLLATSSEVTNADEIGDVVLLSDVSYGGPGCPEGSVQVLLSPDASALTVLYDRFALNFEASLGVRTLSCEVILNIRKPLRVGLSIGATDFRGFVRLEEGMTADQHVIVSSGTRNKPRKMTAEFGSAVWHGPVSEEYLLTAVKSQRVPEVLDCLPPRENTRIFISSQLRIQSAVQAFGELTVDSADGRLTQRYRLNWHRCRRGNANRQDRNS